MSEPGDASTSPALVTTWMRGSDMSDRICSSDDCAAPAKARGLCWKHYKRLQRAGEAVPTTLVERLWRDIHKLPHGCWDWTGEVSGTGYGRIIVGNTKHTVHRLLYEIIVEPVPGLDLDHLCHTRDGSCLGGVSCPHRRCCNPAHLEPVTPHENWRRGGSPSARNASRTHCINGHPLVDASWNGGRRYCPTCAAERQRRWRERSQQ